MKITFLEAKMALAKQFGVYDEESGQKVDKAYPKAAKFITHTHEVDTIDEYHRVLSDAAKKWYGLLKGKALRELESFTDRKGLTERSDKTKLLILDVDGLEWPAIGNGKLSRQDVIIAAEKLVQMLPTEFSKSSYVAVASSNFGRKAGLRLHLHFILENEIQPDVLRGVITMLNFDIEYVNKNLSLTPSGRQIKYSIDPCIADNGRIVYIAPPIFGDVDDNPFATDADRIVPVYRASNTLDITDLIKAYSVELVEKTKEKRLRQLYAAAGIEFTKAKTVVVSHRGQSVRVLQNPEQVAMEIAEITEQYVRYNVNGGDSNAYWVWMDNPEIVYSFKPDELPFRFKVADNEAYTQHLERFGKQIEKAAAKENDDGYKVVPMMVFDRSANAIITVEYDPFEDVVRSHYINSKEHAENWMVDKGALVPDPIPTYSVAFNPTSNVGHDAAKRSLNTYLPSKVSREAPQFLGDALGFGEAFDWMVMHTPTCAKIIGNMVGDDPMCFEQFINWFAFMVQRREKPETAWVVHGVEGTGKGLFIKRIAKPILGSDYVIEKKLSDISDDKYNGYMEECLLLFVDEFNMNASTSAKATANILKQQITEPTLNIRKMQQNPVQRTTFFGMMFASNDIDAMRLSPTDRRYNVCPRQETPLKVAIPDINSRRAEYDSIIASELPMLASMLGAYEVIEHRVRTPLDNEAKALAAEAGMTTDETFFTAMRRGDFEFFEPLTGLKLKPSAGADYAAVSEIRSIALRWAADLVIQQQSRIAKSELKAVYEFMTGYKVNDISFGRKCKQNGLREMRFGSDGRRVIGFTLTWTFNDHQYLKDMLESTADVAKAEKQNVVNIKG